MGFFARMFGRGGLPAERPHRPEAPRIDAVSWAQLTEVLGPPPLGPAGTSQNPAGGVYGESNPNSRAYTKADCARFEAAMGRAPTREEQRMIEARHLGWGYQ